MSGRAPRTAAFTLTSVEVAHLRELVSQFASLLESGPADGALDRLTPDAYPDDSDASRDFRGLTRSDLLARRAQDAAVVGRDLDMLGESVRREPHAHLEIVLDEEAVGPWLRTLTALRLLMASMLGVENDAAHDEADPSFALYDWLGYRLDVLLRASEPD